MAMMWLSGSGRAAVALALVGAALLVLVGLFLGPLVVPWPLLTAGAALALVVILARRGHGRAALAVALIAVPAGVASMVAGILVAERVVCEQREERVLREIPPLQGANPGVAGDIDSGGCVIRYTVSSQPRAVLGYYEARLNAAGWRLVGAEVYEPGRVGEGFAERDGFSQSIFWSRLDSGTRVVVAVHD